MGVFNFMETFFFISLGITFILILLLVYHFKQRLVTVERKTDTMVDIMNNMVKEMTVIKTVAYSQIPQQPPPIQYNQIPSSVINSQMPVSTQFPFQQPVKVEDDSESDDESESGSDSDDESESESDSDDESESEGESESESEGESELANGVDDTKKIIVSDEDEESPPPVEVELLNISTIDIIPEETQKTDNDMINDILANVSNEEIDEIDPINPNNTPVGGSPPQELEVSVSTEGTDSVILSKEDTTEDYSKMSLNQLKSAVVEKGLVNDASKMKKKQLLHLLQR